MSHWTPKVDARVRLAKALKGNQHKRIKVTDLDALIQFGEAAKAADQDQRVQLATSSVAVTERSMEASNVVARETELRDVTPAIIADLEAAGRTSDALFLKRLTFARFRQRELAADAGDGAVSEADASAVKAVERVAREDHVSRANGLAAFVATLLSPGREAIAASFAERDVASSELEAIRSAALAVASAGANRLAAAEATERESKAVDAQQKVWSSIRRLLRQAVKEDVTLSQIYAEC